MKTLLTDLRNDLRDCNIGWKDILEFAYIILITNIALILGFLLWLERKY